MLPDALSIKKLARLTPRNQSTSVVPIGNARCLVDRFIGHAGRTSVLLRECLFNGIDVVDAAAPGAAAEFLQQRPQTRIVRQVRVGGQRH
jgi:hypothetical protein